MVRGYLTTSGELNSILAAGRADLCLMEEQGWSASGNGF
jgi:hypothetical protein